MKIETKKGTGFYDEDQLKFEGQADIYDENECVFGEIFEDGEIILFDSVEQVDGWTIRSTDYSKIDK